MKLVIFDIDGTLLDCKGLGRKSLSLTLEHIYGIKDAFEKVDFRGKVDSTLIPEVMDEHGITNFNYEEFYYRYSENILKACEEGFEVKVLPNVIKVLEELGNSDKIYYGLATGNSKAGALAKLQCAELLEYFEMGAFGDEETSRQRILRLAYENAVEVIGTKIEKTDVFYVGDTLDDIAAARENGFKVVSVPTGFETLENLKAAGPDYIIDDIIKLIDIVRG